MATLAVTIAVALFIVAFIRFLVNYVNEIKLCRKYPTPSLPLPLIGHSHLLYNVNREDIVETIIELSKCDTVKRKMATVIGFNPFIWYYHPEPVEEILSSTELISKSDEYSYMRVSNKYPRKGSRFTMYPDNKAVRAILHLYGPCAELHLHTHTQHLSILTSNP